MGKIKVIKKSTLSGRAEANDYKIYPVTKTDAVFTDSDDKDECDTQTPQGANKTAKEIFNSIRKKGWVNKERIKDGAVTWDKLTPEAQKVIEAGIGVNGDLVHDMEEWNDRIATLESTKQSLEEENIKQNERLDNAEAKDREFQTTLDNITKTGEASAASNVTYNHNDSNLDATNVQQAIDEVRKRSNYNDGENIIDFNTIHLITDNPEYICVAVDADEKILYGIKTDGQPYFGVGCPQQVKDYIDEQINKILGTDDITTTIDSLNEIEDFLKDFTNSDTLKKLLDLKANVDEVRGTTDDIYKKSNPNDSEGNVVDTNTIISIEDNPEYIKALTDSVGKLIEAIGIDGIRKFFAGINIQGTLQCVTDNPEYIAVWLDNNGKIIFAIENDGNPYFGYGVPKQIKEFAEDLNIAISSKIDELMQALENAKTDVDKKIHLGDNTYPVDVHKVSENPEYMSVILDAAQKILEAYGIDGIKRLFTAIELMGTKMSVEDNPEFIKVDVDKGNKILGGFKANGDYIFGAGVPTQIQVKAKEIADNLDTANAIDLDSDIDGNIYASTGKDGNIDITSDDEGIIYMAYDTDKLDIKDAYEDMNGNLIVEQNKVIIL